jgi:hypothetical protein
MVHRLSLVRFMPPLGLLLYTSFYTGRALQNWEVQTDVLSVTCFAQIK